MKVSGLGDRYIDKVKNAEEGVLSNGTETFPDRTDRVYLNAEACSVIHDAAMNRNIDVVHHHHSNVVGWNQARRSPSAWAICRMTGTKPLFASKPAASPKRRKPAKRNRLAWRKLSAS